MITWRSVEEVGFPKLQNWVLVVFKTTTRKRSITVGCRMPLDLYGYEWIMLDTDGYEVIEECDFNGEITHWAPLPEELPEELPDELPEEVCNGVTDGPMIPEF